MAFYSGSMFLVQKYKHKIGIKSKNQSSVASHFTNCLLSADELKE